MARGDLNASQIGRHERGVAVSDRDIETTVLRILTLKLGLSERTVQRLQELAGERGESGRQRAAVRRADLESIGRVSQMSSRRVNAAPTEADYNALRDDVRMLFEAMERIAQAMRST